MIVVVIWPRSLTIPFMSRGFPCTVMLMHFNQAFTSLRPVASHVIEFEGIGIRSFAIQKPLTTVLELEYVLSRVAIVKSMLNLDMLFFII